jgi:D-sedoheptulose 7-phosphate isomerase
MDPRTFLNQVAEVLHGTDTGEISALTDAVERCYREGRFVFIVGNGGSGSNASHMCEDLGKGTLTDLERQKRLKVLSLTDNTPYILAWGNDEGYDRIFVEQLKNLASPGDLLIAISGSGNSPNILRATEYADRIGMETFGMTGFTGGKLKQLCKQTLHIQVHDMGITESMHTVVFHYLIVELKERFRRVHEETPPPIPPPHLSLP